jgi:hypothetical protein
MLVEEVGSSETPKKDFIKINSATSQKTVIDSLRIFNILRHVSGIFTKDREII